MKILMDSELTRKWNVQNLWPELRETEVAEKLADHFNNISKDFTTVSASPQTYDRYIANITEGEMSASLKSFKKPASTVPGNLPPMLITTVMNGLMLG